jgi:hypothetical protein
VSLFGGSPYLFLAALAPRPAAAQAEVVRDRSTLPFEFTILNPCFGDDGELVMVSGEYEVRTQVVTDAAGGVHSTAIAVPHLVGVGLESGITYDVAGPA